MTADCFFIVYPPASSLVWSITSIVPSAAAKFTMMFFCHLSISLLFSILPLYHYNYICQYIYKYNYNYIYFYKLLGHIRTKKPWNNPGGNKKYKEDQVTT